MAIKHTNYDTVKNILILGAGGVTPSIIVVFKQNECKKYLYNRTQSKAENLKKPLMKSKLLWGTIPDFDMIINATSLGFEK